MEIIPSNLEPSPLSLESDISSFDCGDGDLNEFLREDALEYQEQNLAQTMLLYYKSKLAGYYTIACDAIFLALEEKAKVWSKKTVIRLCIFKTCQNGVC